MAHVGLEFALAAFLLGAVGWWVDGKLGTKPWGMVVGGSVGLAGGFYLFLKEAMAANREANDDAKGLRRERQRPHQAPLPGSNEVPGKEADGHASAQVGDEPPPASSGRHLD